MKEPIAFLSYVRFDDQHENGRLTEFRTRLSGEVRVQTGKEFHIFQDRSDIGWGQQWRKRIEESIDAVTFLIPILTPGFFLSEPCRAELERFLDRERKLGRGDLILPVYYVNCRVLGERARREADPLATVIAARQYADWRELRFEPFTSPVVGKTVATLALQIVAALERPSPPRPPAPVKVEAVPQPATAAGSVSEPARAGIEQTPRVERGPAPKTEPPTRVVDALHRGDHATLTEALKAARPGDRILVRPGLYREGIVIDKPVEIIGDGELGEAVIEATGKDAVLFKASMGRLANLTLRQVGGGQWYCIDIAQGRLDVEGCDITSQSLACVAIHDGADPLLRRNRIHDGKSAGVYVYEDGRGTLEDNEIFGNAYAGVEIRTGGDPTLRRNRIHDGKQGGVYVNEDGRGTLEDNEIIGNAFRGVTIETGGNPTLRRNRISHNGEQGIKVHKSGQGVFEDNDLRENAKGAWLIAPECEEKVTRRGNKE
jgi:F-box protein 11